MKSPSLHFIFSFALLALIIAGYGAWYARVAGASTAAASLESEIQNKLATAARTSSTRAALAEIADNEAVVSAYFVPQAGVVDFIDGLEALGRELGTAVTVLSVSAGNGGSHPSLVITLSAKGSFDAVMRTVGAIEFSPYALSLSTLSLEQSELGGWTANLTLLLGSTLGASSTPNTEASAPTPPPHTTPAATPSGAQPL